MPKLRRGRHGCSAPAPGLECSEAWCSAYAPALGRCIAVPQVTPLTWPNGAQVCSLRARCFDLLDELTLTHPPLTQSVVVGGPPPLSAPKARAERLQQQRQKRFRPQNQQLRPMASCRWRLLARTVAPLAQRGDSRRWTVRVPRRTAAVRPLRPRLHRDVGSATQDLQL